MRLEFIKFNNDNRSASYTKALFEDNARFIYHGNVILSDTQNMQTFILIKKKVRGVINNAVIIV